MAGDIANAGQATELVVMGAAAFERFLEVGVPAYAREKVAAGQWPEDEALDRSRREIEELLPQGPLTPGNYLFEMHAAGESVGALWFAAAERGGKKVAYLYDIVVRPEHRRKGHATRALIAAEDKVRELGLSGIALHVFGHNGSARALYEKLGFVPTNINLYKPVSG